MYILEAMKTTALTISAWGNSHGIRLSRELMQSLGITPDTALQATVLAKGCLELRAVNPRPYLAASSYVLAAQSRAVSGASEAGTAVAASSFTGSSFSASIGGK